METGHTRGTERLVLAIGEITATYRTVLTPSGSAPVNAVRWTVREAAPARGRMWRRTAPGEQAPHPVRLTVTVSGPGWQHVERLGPATREEVATVRGRVTQARMLALRAVVWSPATTAKVPARPVADGLVEPAR